MSEEQFAQISLYVCVGGLISYMVFIMYRLGKDSNAGKFGMAMIFLILGLGVFAFVGKEIAVHFLE